MERERLRSSGWRPLDVGFALLLSAAAWLAFTFDRPVSSGLDGAFYYQIARHVAEGRGLLTSVSLYHQALDPLPQTSSIYPAWPLLLGGVGRVVGIERAAFVLPRLLYLLAIALAFVAARRVGERLRVPVIAPAAALLLALNPTFLLATALPYTDGLAMALLLAVLLAVDLGMTSSARGAQVAAAAAAATLAGLAYATRFQMLGAVVAVPLLPWPRPRRTLLRGVALAAAALPVGLVVLHVARVPGFTPAMLVDFSAHRQAPGLPPFAFTVATGGLVDLVIDRSRGLPVAFDPGSPWSYAASFGIAALAVPPAAALAAWRWQRAQRTAGPATPGVIVAALLVGGLTLAPVHLTHAEQWRPWLFGWRHGLPFLLLLVPALGLLEATLRRRSARLAPWVVGLLVGVSAAQGAARIAALRRSGAAGDGALAEAGAWLDRRRPRPAVLAMEPQPLAVHSRASFHWTSCWDDPAYLEGLLHRVRIDLVLLRPSELGCPSLAPLRGRLERVHAVGEHEAYRLLPPASPGPG